MTVARVGVYPIPGIDGQFNLDGFLFGQQTSYAVLSVAGLDLPVVRFADTARSLHHGSFGSQDTGEVRTITFDIMVMQRPGDPTMSALLTALGFAFRPRGADVAMTMQVAGSAFQLLSLGRPRHCNWTLVPGFNQQGWPTVHAVAEFIGLDPLLYSAVVQDTGTIPLANAGVDAGLSYGVYTGAGPYPLGATYGVYTGGAPFPLGAAYGSDTPGGGVGSGFVTVTNSGNEPTAPVTTIFGPVDTPWIQLVETGQAIQLNIVLGAADVLELDHDLRSVWLNGVANRQNVVDPSTSWWLIPAGNFTVHYRSVGAGVGSSADVKWRHAKWSQ